jgi:hypothetical protein
MAAKSFLNGGEESMSGQRMLPFSMVLMTFLGVGPAANSARATFMIATNPSGDQFFNGAANKDVTSFTGTVGGQHSGPQVTVTTTGAVDTGAGFSNIKPVKDGTLTKLTFTPANGNLYDGFSFRGQLLAAGSVKLTVKDNQGDPAQSFTFTNLPKDADFDRIGIIAVAGSGETIQSVTIENAGFKEVKQVEFSDAPITPVPEPASLTLLGLGAVSLCGYSWLRRKRST